MDLALDPAGPAAADALREFTRGDGLECAIDCSGNPTGQNMTLDSVQPLGRVGFVGESRETTIRPSDQLSTVEARVTTRLWINSTEKFCAV